MLKRRSHHNHYPHDDVLPPLLEDAAMHPTAAVSATVKKSYHERILAASITCFLGFATFILMTSHMNIRNHHHYHGSRIILAIEPDDDVTALPRHQKQAKKRRYRDDDKSLKESSSVKKKDKQCRIYIAPTSVKGFEDGGFGIYTTDDIIQGESLLRAPDGPNIPIWDYHHHYQSQPQPKRTQSHNDDPDNDIVMNLAVAQRDWIRVWNHYWWANGVSDYALQQENYDQIICDYQIMFGSLPNHHCVLGSIDYYWIDDYHNPNYDNDIYMDSDYHSYPNGTPSGNTMKYQYHHGSGAYSYYGGRDFYVTRNVSAGNEIFLDYGYCDIANPKEYPDWAKHTPKEYHFVVLSQIMRYLHHYITEYHHTPKSDDTKRQETSKSKEPINEVYQDLLKRAKRKVSVKQPEHIMEHLLPPNYGEYLRVNQSIPSHVWTDMNSNSSTAIARVLAKQMGTHHRTVDWIRSHGLCLENLIPQRSTVPHAGRGAFAQFPMKSGEVIVPAAMLQIVNQDVLALYKNDRNNDDDHDDERYSTQLLINYCFGHTNSTLLLCPTTNAILINHCSDRMMPCGGNGGGPNAMYRWATTWDKDTAQWLQMPLSEMIQQHVRGLSMEIIALRDIQPGEEIFIDYGKEWEDAWLQHQKVWYERRMSEKYTERYSIQQLNKQKSLTVLVSDNLRTNLEDEMIRTMCIYWPTPEDQSDIYKKPNDQWHQWDDAKILSTYATDAKRYRSYQFRTHVEYAFWPCSIIRADDDDHDDENRRYIVRIYQQTANDNSIKMMPWHTNDVPRFVTGYPIELIRYMYHPYHSDLNLPNVFRHHIEIRNDIFPEIWKNKK